MSRLINQLHIIKDTPVALCIDGTMWALDLRHKDDDEGAIDLQTSGWVQLPPIPPAIPLRNMEDDPHGVQGGIS